MRDITNEAIYFESIAVLHPTPPSVAVCLNAAEDLHDHATQELREARNWEKVPTYAYKGIALRDKALDDHLAATDELRAAVTAQDAELAELRDIVREQSAQIAGLLELIEARAAWHTEGAA